MFRLLLCCCLLSAPLGAQDFAPVTVVCTEGPYELRSPLTDGQPYAYRWERSFDGGTSWSATGSNAAFLTVPSPTVGIRYRMVYGADTTCLEDATCRQTTATTELSVRIPTFSQGLTRCDGDTVFVGEVALTTAGNHRTVLRTAAGCDSIVNTFLQLRDRYADLYFLDRCAGEDVNGTTVFRDTTIVEHLTASTGCDSTVTYEVNVSLDANAGLVIDGPAAACAADGPPTLRAPGGYAGYRWSTGETGQSITPAAGGTYRLTVTDVTGCVRELSHELSLHDLAIGEVATNAPACPGSDDGSLTISATGDDLLYSVDGGASFRMTPVFNELAAGDYDVVVENAAGCQVATSITVPAAPELNLTSDAVAEQVIERGDSLPLRLTANFPVTEWRWTPARWTSRLDSVTTLLFPTVDADFRVEAVAAGGCAVSDTFRITVLDSRRYFAPTAFSPNGDDRNDVWRLFPGPRATAISDLQIADRWGGIRYVQPEAALPPEEAGWDGTENGTPLPPGNYLYSAAIRFADGSTLPVRGQITLLR
ncbi:MAG: T9SS type B sorting domain-containing protein [Bacteroidota bacterium]